MKNLKFFLEALEEFTKFSRISLAWFGVWPTYRNKILSKILFFISLVAMMFSIVLPQGIKLFQVWGNLDLVSQIISTAELPYMVVLTKMSVLFYNKERVYFCKINKILVKK